MRSVIYQKVSDSNPRTPNDAILARNQISRKEPTNIGATKERETRKRKSMWVTEAVQNPYFKMAAEVTTTVFTPEASIEMASRKLSNEIVLHYLNAIKKLVEQSQFLPILELTYEGKETPRADQPCHLVSLSYHLAKSRYPGKADIIVDSFKSGRIPIILVLEAYGFSRYCDISMTSI